MPDDIQSIENLIQSSQGNMGNDDSPAAKFAKKQTEIKIKEKEMTTKQKAAIGGWSYVDLFGFPISPEALSLIPREVSESLKLVCFFYDGKEVRFATLDPENEEVRSTIRILSEKLYCHSGVYLVSEHSFDYAIELYNNLPKIRKFVNGVEIK